MQQKGRVPWAYIVPALIILGVIIGLVYYETTYAATNTSTSLQAGNFNWPIATVTGNLVIHIHPWLRITINGKNVTVPQGIGCISDNTGQCVEPMHTHDSSGVIHIESDTNTNYTLGQFFAIWSASYAYALVNGAHEPIVFNNTDILGYKVNSSSDSLKLLVDGTTPAAGDFSGSPSQYGNLVMNVLDYCSSALPANSAPCAPTDAEANGAIGNPYWNGVTGYAPAVSGGYPYGVGHTIVIEYTS
jgi:hypothetical protein